MGRQELREPEEGWALDWVTHIGTVWGPPPPPDRTKKIGAVQLYFHQRGDHNLEPGSHMRKLVFLTLFSGPAQRSRVRKGGGRGHVEPPEA